MSEKFIAAKFGGTSMAKPPLVRDIVANNPDHKVIVVSAPGKSEGYDVKMTDMLGSLAIAIVDGKDVDDMQNAIVERFNNLYQDVATQERLQILELLIIRLGQIATAPNPVDFAMSLGEEFSARYFAALSGNTFVDAKDWVSFDEDSNLETVASVNALSQILQQTDGQIVTPGFYGVNDIGERNVLPRGGSDISGALAAFALLDVAKDGHKVEYYNYTDQNGVHSADPRQVKDTVVLPELTEAEMREGAIGGNGVLELTVMKVLQGANIPIVIKNTFNPDLPGTRITKNRETKKDESVVTVSARRLQTISIHELGMGEQKGYLEKVLSIASDLDLSIEHMPAGQDDITFTLHEKTSKKVLEEFDRRLKDEVLGDYADVNIQLFGIIYCVGEGLRDGLMRAKAIIRLSQALVDNNIGIETIITHPKGASVAVVVAQEDTKKALELLHRTFI